MAEITDQEKQTWGNKLFAAKEALAGKWAEALLAFKVYKLARDKFDIPLTDAAGWTDADQQKLLNLQEIVVRSIPGAEDALSGQRVVEIDPTLGTLKIGLLPSDPYVIALQGKDVVLLDAKTQAPVNMSGQVGDGWAILLGIVSPLAFVIYEAFQVTHDVLEYQKTKLKAQTELDLQNKCAELVTAGKYTPAECNALLKQIQDGQRALIDAETKKVEAENVSPTADVLKQGLWVIVAVGALGLGFYALQNFAPRRAAHA
jgi:hypothetical protein